jgi:hypothetical protein
LIPTPIVSASSSTAIPGVPLDELERFALAPGAGARIAPIRAAALGRRGDPLHRSQDRGAPAALRAPTFQRGALVAWWVRSPSGAARYGPCVDHVRLPDPRLVVDGRRVGCSTRLAYAGAYQLTIWTIVPGLATELHSSYLGHPGGHTVAAHLQLRPGEPPLTVTADHAGAELPVREARRLCLYDHLAVLRQLVADATGKDAAVDVTDQTLALVDVA